MLQPMSCARIGTNGAPWPKSSYTGKSMHHGDGRFMGCLARDMNRSLFSPPDEESEFLDSVALRQEDLMRIFPYDPKRGV